MGGQGTSIISQAMGDDAFFFFFSSFSRVCGKVREMSRGSARDGFGFNDVKGLQRTREKGEKENCLTSVNVTGGLVSVCILFFCILNQVEVKM